MCKALALEVCFRRRVRALALASCGALPNGRPELGLVVSGECWNERTNHILFDVMEEIDQAVGYESDNEEEIQIQIMI